MATPRLGLVVENKPTELSCIGLAVAYFSNALFRFLGIKFSS